MGFVTKMQEMIDRFYRRLVVEKLEKYPAVSLLGPRQCGKTTLAKHFGDRYFDIENLEPTLCRQSNSPAKPFPIRENSSYLIRSIPLVSPFGPTFGGSISRLPPRSIVVKKSCRS
jgi:hypothetical protein